MFPLPQQDYTVMVVSLTYNHAPYIEDALKGFVMQRTNFPVVVCVLDDCSTDGTADIVRRYEAQYPDLIKGFYFEENQFSQGKFTYEALIPWLEKVKYIALCEGDDYWTDPLKLQKQVDFMKGHEDCTMCFHNAMIDREDSNCEPRLENHLDTREYYPCEFFEKWVITTASILFRANVLQHEETIRFISDKRFVQYDVVLWMCCAYLGKVYGLEEAMSFHRILKRGFTSSFSNKFQHVVEWNYRYCIHNKTLIEVFGDRFGVDYESIIRKYLIQYGRYGLALSVANLQFGYMHKIFSLIWSESILQALLSIFYVPKIMTENIYTKYLSPVKRRIFNQPE